ncbi:MAG: type II toxin-antitoxin system MqsR family toxin [Nitrospira sp. SB0675_bin_23]|nr:type II toxin-antitoxin system MqsR family toxin [Nitrospira sp. SB0675_bin_23]
MRVERGHNAALRPIVHLIRGSLKATGSAVRNAATLGFGRAEIVETIQSIQKTHFHKSMTSDTDHRIWQDVYDVPSKAGRLYIKFTANAVTEFLLLSFKEKKHG